LAEDILSQVKVAALPEGCMSDKQFAQPNQGSGSTLCELAAFGEDESHEKAARIV
jgi:hypothetical protein